MYLYLENVSDSHYETQSHDNSFSVAQIKAHKVILILNRHYKYLHQI